MKQLNISTDDRPVVSTALNISESTDAPVTAIELHDGRIIHGKASDLLSSTSAMLLNALKALANLGMLSHFVGMLTDSRSFVSYTRHEYFRRILCNLLGKWVEDGEYPRDMETLKKIASDISYYNAKNYFGF